MIRVSTREKGEVDCLLLMMILILDYVVEYLQQVLVVVMVAVHYTRLVTLPKDIVKRHKCRKTTSHHWQQLQYQ